MSAITAKASRKMKKYAVLTREPRCFLGSFDFSWEQRKLGELVDRVVRKNTNNESTLPLTISAQYGLVDQITYFNNRVASRDVSNYYLVLNGEFAYNKSTSDGYPFGAVKRLDLYEKGVLSTLYIVFAPKKEQQIDSDYLTVFFDTDRWHKGVAERAAEGARNHGLLNISAEDFFDIDLSVPKDIVEQKQIGAFIRQLDNLITLHQRKCANLCSPSQVVFSLLFATSTFSWEQRKVQDVADRLDNLRIPVAANLRVHGTTPYYGANGIQDYVEGFTHDGEFVLVAEDGANDLKNYPVKCVNGRIWVNNHAHVLQGKAGISDNSFLAFAISQSDIESLLVGGSRAKLNAETLMSIEFKLPCLQEQYRIGEYLTQLDHLITLHQRECISFTGRADRLILTANKKRTTSSWEQRKLGDIADIVGGGTPSTGNQSYWDGDIDWYAPAEIADQIYANSSQKKITGLGYENSSAKMLPPGTVLFTSRAGIGKTAILTRKGCTNQGFQSIVPHRGELDSYFIFSRTGELKRYGELVGAGSTFVEVSGKQMAVMELMMPPTMREQQTIGGFFQQLDHLITLHQRKPFLMKWRTSDANRNQTNRLVL